MTTNIELLRHPDGTLTSFSRHYTVNGRRGSGSLVVYEGEAKEVMELVLMHSQYDPKRQRMANTNRPDGQGERKTTA